MDVPNVNFTPDLVILAVISLAVVYGLLLGRDKVKTFALSVYVGLVLAASFGPSLTGLLEKNNWDLDGKINPTMIQLVLFVLPMLLLELGQKGRGHKGLRRGGMVLTLVLSVVTAALIVSSGLSLLNTDVSSRILEQSWLATNIYRFRLWWIGAVPILVIGENLTRSKD